MSKSLHSVHFLMSNALVLLPENLQFQYLIYKRSYQLDYLLNTDLKSDNKFCNVPSIPWWIFFLFFLNTVYTSVNENDYVWVRTRKKLCMKHLINNLKHVISAQ